jgi:hypothetical protein
MAITTSGEGQDVSNLFHLVVGLLLGCGVATIIFAVLWVRIEPWVDKYVDVEGKRERENSGEEEGTGTGVAGR